MSGVTVFVQSLVIGSSLPGIHDALLPFHTPTPLARCSCILPGVAASAHACMSASVQPGGSFISGAALAAAAAAAGFASFDGSATANDATTADSATATSNAGAISFFPFIVNLP